MLSLGDSNWCKPVREEIDWQGIMNFDTNAKSFKGIKCKFSTKLKMSGEEFSCNPYDIKALNKFLK